MGRKRVKSRSGSGRGGLMTSMRGGFRSAVKSATGDKGSAPVSPTRKLLMNLLTAALLIAAVVLVLRRFGLLR